MKILLALPKGSGYMGQVSKSGRAGIARLSLTTVAAITPPEHQVVIHDARLGEPDYDADWDVVGFTAMTAEISDAYRMADEFRRRGKHVVFGGYHATGLPDEAAEHADAVIVGESEVLWPRVLGEIGNGGLTQKVYRNDEYVVMEDMANPCRHLLDRRMYSMFSTIQTTRGCPHDCGFCSVTRFFGRSFRHRPVAEIIHEIESLPEKRWMFLDDNLTGNSRYARELLKAMIPLRIEWGAQASIHLAHNPELMDLYAEAGGKYVFIGLESVSAFALDGVQKGWNHPENYAEGIDNLHRRGIAVLGSFIFGLDGDDIGVFRRTVDFVNEAKIDAVLYNILTPFPGTDLYNQMKNAGRIHDFNWSNYDCCHSVIRPARMTSEELQDGWQWANRETYKWSSILKRVVRRGAGWKNRVALAGSYARKARKYCPVPPHPERFAEPCPSRVPGLDTVEKPVVPPL